MADSLEKLKAQYEGIKECQSDMSKAGVSSRSSQMRIMTNQLGKLSKKIEKLEKGR